MSARNGPKPKVSAIKARQLIIEHGGIRAAARASGFDYHSLYRAHNAFMDENQRHKVCVFSDVHVKIGLENDHLRWIGRWIKDSNPSFVINNGDYADLPSMCGHEPNETHRGKLKPALKADLDYFEECALMLTEESGRNDIVFVEGNHDGPRILRFEDSHPETVGLLFSRYEDVLRKAKWQRIPFGRDYNLLGVDFVHAPMNGMGRPSGGLTAVRNAAVKSVRDVVFSHTHKAGSHREPKRGNDQWITAVNTGCAMPIGYIPEYAIQGETGWWHGVVELIIQHGRIQDVSFISMETLRERYA